VNRSIVARPRRRDTRIRAVATSSKSASTHVSAIATIPVSPPRCGGWLRVGTP
jgi:hypothetical protein